METRHRILVEDARTLESVADASVELVVTSPPYPMIELWDDLFCELSPDVATALESGEGREAFEHMHAMLDDVWNELARVLVEGGIVCVNIGDATRTIAGEFRRYANHARIVRAFEELGFAALPDVLWRKPTNSAAKFMGSGMLPPSAYVTLEHEYILPFRYGGRRREFAPGATQRYESAYFWEERNDWFSDLWSDVTGTGQAMEDVEARGRSAAFPVEIPYRLIAMYSVYGDTVLDPFWGTGTTSVAAMAAARNSIGVELDRSVSEVFDARVDQLPALAEEIGRTRLERHQEFVSAERNRGQTFAYEATHYDFPVKTAQEREIRLYGIETLENTDNEYTLSHTPIDSG